MDESIKKKRKCKRGYDEKLGENSPLRKHFLPSSSPAFPTRKKRSTKTDRKNTAAALGDEHHHGWGRVKVVEEGE
jgi:hypothetical protein